MSTFNTLSYKGYTARIDFDVRDDIFVGHVLGTSDVISFHANTVSDLHEAFETAIDHFLDYCKKHGIQPDKPASGQMMLRVPPDVHARALIAAKASGKSLNQWASEVFDRAMG